MNQDSKTPSSTAPKPSTLVGSGTSITEGLKGLFCGVLFGITSPLVGHPFDSLKTKMQAQSTYAFTKDSTFKILRNIIKQEGFLALYKGLTPPLVGSSIFRAVQFASYSTMYAALRNESWATFEISSLGDMQIRVFIAAIFSTTCRTIIETPLEMLKVRRQTQQSWLPPSTNPLSSSSSLTFSKPFIYIKHIPAILQSLYRGFSITWIRTLFALGGFFVIIDHVDRHHHHWLNIPYIGPFVKGSLCTTLAWWMSWPFEVVKNQTQANTPLHNTTNNNLVIINARTRMKYLLNNLWYSSSTERITAIQLLFRGIGPGTVRSMLANGAALSVYTMCQKSIQ